SAFCLFALNFAILFFTDFKSPIVNPLFNWCIIQDFDDLPSPFYKASCVKPCREQRIFYISI
ncbi:hypothetical protein, partial [Helicobacter ganmani]|uniref:hypothetical protein n=1 Tax=Helicobacter ganmani TaxID=60246 RepID=UPI003A8A00DD